jgi:hypothetical protein
MTERKRTKGQEEFEDTKGAIRIRISKNRQHNDRKKKGQKDKKSLKIPKGQSESVYRKRTDNTMTERKRTKGQEEFEDTKGAIRIRISKKNRQHNDREKKDKRTRRV